ncbi:MAG: MOSC domain-containing protein [Myxococcota bacterium]
MLADALAALPPPPRDRGTVAMVVVRPSTGLRETPAAVELTVEGGVAGDRWALGSRDPRAQVTLMRIDVARLFAEDVAAFGDNLFVDLDLALPAGTRLVVGAAVLEVTDKPHTGCRKFAERAGDEALALTRAVPDRVLRGIHARVIVPGRVAVGDPVVISGR